MFIQRCAGRHLGLKSIEYMSENMVGRFKSEIYDENVDFWTTAAELPTPKIRFGGAHFEILDRSTFRKFSHNIPSNHVALHKTKDIHCIMR